MQMRVDNNNEQKKVPQSTGGTVPYGTDWYYYELFPLCSVYTGSVPKKFQGLC